MYRGKTPQKLIIPPPNLADQIGSAVGLTSIPGLTARKRKSTFMTQMSKKLTNEQLVSESHTQLINYIDNLQDKVQKIIESHDSQFLLAYRNHLNRVRQEMQELKNKNANDANSASNQTEKIQTLEKQLIIFREQALKLFDKMSEKDKNIEFLNMKIYELQTQQKYSKKTISDLMKRNKYLEGIAKEFKYNQQQKEQNQSKQKSMSFMEANTMRKYSSNQRRASKNLGWTVNSFFNKNQGANSQQDKQSRPTTTALGSKRNTISVSNSHHMKSLNPYFTRNVISNQIKG